MAQTSIGFAGAVNEAAWSKLSAFLGSNPCVGTAADLALSAVGGVRRVLVAAGSAYQDGILTTLSVGESPAVDIAAPAAGQWHLVVLRRVWATKVTSLVYIPHTTTTNVLPTSAPTTYPAALLAAPGTSSDQVLGWAWANVTTTVLALWDLRKLPDSTRLAAIEPAATFAGSSAARDAFWGAPGDATARRALQDKGARWLNTDALKGWTEQYFEAYNVTTNPNGATPAGWYPVGGACPVGTLARSATVVSAAGGNNVLAAAAWTPGAMGGGMVYSSDGFTVPVAGRYRVALQVTIAATGGPSATAQGQAMVLKNSVLVGGSVAYNTMPLLANRDCIPQVSRILTLAAGDILRPMWWHSAGGTVSIWTGSDASWFELSYVGPPQ